MSAKPLKWRLVLFGCVLLTAVVSAGAYTEPQEASAPSPMETRCGWFVNPTPANISLYDRAGEWIIGVQGSYQVEDDWKWPQFKPGQWVETNGNYGHGCACLQLRVDKETHRVLEIKSARARPLSACRRDRALKRWARMLE